MHQLAFRPKRHGGVNVVLGPKAVDNRCPEVSTDQNERSSSTRLGHEKSSQGADVGPERGVDADDAVA
jgi:hypothetical protein